ncbi:hypothetical protein SNEBB_002597 [Seison nebaliae]|nr:hypothetical protein SNEBB_002597 [Seison nebaliae]
MNKKNGKMNFKLLFVFVSALFAQSLAKNNECTTNDDCGHNGCCVKNYSPFIMSKRDLGMGLKPWDSMVHNICGHFILENQNCKYLGMWSCGCEPGTKCQKTADDPNFVLADPNVKPLRNRRMMAYRPGTWQCVKQASV